MRTPASDRATEDERYRRPSSNSARESHSTKPATVASSTIVASVTPRSAR